MQEGSQQLELLRCSASTPTAQRIESVEATGLPSGRAHVRTPDLLDLSRVLFILTSSCLRLFISVHQRAQNATMANIWQRLYDEPAHARPWPARACTADSLRPCKQEHCWCLWQGTCAFSQTIARLIPHLSGDLTVQGSDAKQDSYMHETLDTHGSYQNPCPLQARQHQLQEPWCEWILDW